MIDIKALMLKSFASIFRFIEYFGFHLTPTHHYFPIPRTKELTNDIFNKRSECIGIDWNIDTQKYYINKLLPSYLKEVVFAKNKGLSILDSAVLHMMIRHHKPKKMIEIGCGASTRIAARAIMTNLKEGYPCELISIDPFPDKDIINGFPGLSKIIVNKVEKINYDEIIDCDLLFIDSSHVVKIGGDVNYEILELVPRIKNGALIHWHDILIPDEYCIDWVKGNLYFWSEQYLLHAFLKYNREYEILWASRYLHINKANELKAAFPAFAPENSRNTSFWIKRVVK